MAQPCFTDKLNSAINSGCQNQTVGVERDGILVARQFIDESTLAYDAGTVVVNTFELVGADKGYKVTQNAEMPFKAVKIEGERGEYVLKFNSTAGFLILGNSPYKVKQVMQLGNDEYYLILQNKSYTATEKNKYMLLAPSKGLTTTKAAFAMENQDAFGWTIEMMEKEALLPVAFIWKTDEATTDAIIAAIIA
jgi:hypothetical protein